MREKRISSVLHFERRFLRSIQLERDYKDPTSLAGYVVTSQIRSYVERLAAGLHQNSGQRAWRITGGYGSGKSSFALLLAHAFGGKESELPPQVRRSIDLSDVQANKINLLPILVTGSREPLSVAVLTALAIRLRDLSEK